MAAELKGTPQLGFDSSPLKHMRSSGTKHDCIAGSSVQLIEMTCLLKLLTSYWFYSATRKTANT